MPDDVIPGNAMPGTWHDAFAALPQEAPPAHGWEHLAARMDTQAAIARKQRAHGRTRAWIGLAVAASMVLTVTLWERGEPRQAIATQPAIVAATAPASEAAIPKPADRREPVGTASAAITKPANRRKPDVRIAAHTAPVKPAPAKPAPLDDLYAESAQLEALLALARDDRVSSAGAALLSDELDAQVAAIDASLAQSDLDDGERLRLWQARVDALRQAAGFESTQRLLASQGRSDVMLVSVD
jgi:hypothetical protein